MRPGVGTAATQYRRKEVGTVRHCADRALSWIKALHSRPCVNVNSHAGKEAAIWRAIREAICELRGAPQS